LDTSDAPATPLRDSGEEIKNVTSAEAETSLSAPPQDEQQPMTEKVVGDDDGEQSQKEMATDLVPADIVDDQSPEDLLVPPVGEISAPGPETKETGDVPPVLVSESVPESKEAIEADIPSSIPRDNKPEIMDNSVASEPTGSKEVAFDETAPGSKDDEASTLAAPEQSVSKRGAPPLIDTGKRVQFPTSFPTIQEPRGSESTNSRSSGEPRRATSEDPDYLETPKDRVRHFSTTSRILPGGWSFPLQVEGKASLEMASGEFVPLPPRSPKEKDGKCIIM